LKKRRGRRGVIEMRCAAGERRTDKGKGEERTKGGEESSEEVLRQDQAMKRKEV
jgi:hypothetical protein